MGLLKPTNAHRTAWPFPSGAPNSPLGSYSGDLARQARDARSISALVASAQMLVEDAAQAPATFQFVALAEAQLSRASLEYSQAQKAYASLVAEIQRRLVFLSSNPPSSSPDPADAEAWLLKEMRDHAYTLSLLPAPEVMASLGKQIEVAAERVSQMLKIPGLVPPGIATEISARQKAIADLKAKQAEEDKAFEREMLLLADVERSQKNKTSLLKPVIDGIFGPEGLLGKQGALFAPGQAFGKDGPLADLGDKYLETMKFIGVAALVIGGGYFAFKTGAVKKLVG